MARQEKVIVVDVDKCAGCHSCEMACSIKHFGKCSPYLSRIRIQEFREVNTFVPIVCMACEDPACAKVCPMNARVRLTSGALITLEDRCVGCRACIQSCPFGAAVVNPENGKAITCDLCGDDEKGPWCVKACSMQKALVFVDAEDAARAKGRDWAKLLKEEHAPLAEEDDEDFGFSFNL